MGRVIHSVVGICISLKSEILHCFSLKYEGIPVLSFLAQQSYILCQVSAVYHSSEPELCADYLMLKMLSKCDSPVLLSPESFLLQQPSAAEKQLEIKLED